MLLEARLGKESNGFPSIRRQTKYGIREDASLESENLMNHHSNRTYNLAQIARQAMVTYGFEADFPEAAVKQAEALIEPVKNSSGSLED
jgi:hypothetical protein